MKKTKNQSARQTRIIGLDVHPDIYSLCVMEGQTNHDATVLRRYQDLPIAGLEDFARDQLRPADLVLLEAGSNSFEVVRKLEALGISACVLESCQVGKTAQAYLDNDLVAAERIARSYLTGISKVVWVPDEVTSERREILHAYEKAKAQETRAINELKSLLNQYHIRLLKRDARQPATHQWIRGQRAWSQRQLIVLEHLFQQVSFSSGQSETLFARICAEAVSDPMMRGCLRLLGIGPVNAFAIVATAGDIHRFSSPKKLVAYLGLNPGQKQSGKGKHVKIGIGHRGRKTMRSFLIQGAQAVFRQKKPNPLRDWGWQIFVRKGNRNVAVAAIARKLATQLWHLLKGHGITRPEQLKPMATKLTKICQVLGKTGRAALGLPERTTECIAHLMQLIEQPFPEKS